MHEKKTTTPPQEPAPSSDLEHRRAENFVSLYANNVYFESNGWDLRLVFGQLDPKLGPNVVMQHSAVTLTWPQVKVLVYFLQIQLLAHESQHGRIHVPPGVIAQFPERAPDELERQGISQENYKAARQLYEKFIADNPEAVITIAK